MATESGRGQKFLVLEGMRGVAAVLVCIRHTPAWWGPVSFGESYLAVDLFFLLSGVVLAHSYREALVSRRLGAAGFMGLRLLRIYPLYILGSTLGLAAGLAWTDPPLTHPGPAAAMALAFVPDYFTPKGLLFPLDHPSWSLLFELIANLIFVLTIGALTPRRHFWLCGIALAVFGFAIAAFGSADLGYHQIDGLVGLARVVFGFFAGALIARNVDRLRPLFGRLRLRTAPLILMVAVCLMPTMPSEALRVGYDLAMVAVGLPLLVVLAVLTPVTTREAPVLGALGLISYPLYILHAPAYAALQGILGLELGRLAPFSGIALVAGLCGLSYLVATRIDVPLRQGLKVAFASRVGARPRRIAD